MFPSDERCKNCNQHLLLHQRYCHACGQRTDTHRINWHFMFHEVQHGIFHVDSGILFTVRELFLRPGHTLREYVEGRRRPHFKPLLLVVIMGSICALFQYFFKEERPEGEFSFVKADLAGGKIGQYIDYEGLLYYFKHVFEWLSHHFAFTVLLMLPVAALAFYLGFRKYRLNYPEWLVIMLFLAGQSLTVYILFIFLNEYVARLTPLFYLLSWVLILWSLLQFFDGKPRKQIVWRTVFSIFLSYFLSLIYVVLAVSVIALVGIMMYGYETLLPTLLKTL